MNHRSIFIIDDNEQVRIFFRKVLEEAGYMITEAPNAQNGTAPSRVGGYKKARHSKSMGHKKSRDRRSETCSED